MSSTPERRAGRRLALGVYALSLSAPFLCLGALSHAYVARWWRTGTCPGPMDRHGPCGLAELLFVVFFGGWAGFVVVPALVVWSSVSTLALVAMLKRLRR